MLAYSSIAQAGYLLIPVVAHTEFAGKALIYYLAVYSAMNLGAFAVILVREREVQRPVGLEELSGWGYSRPWLGGALALFLFSLASFPPTGGFLAKLYLFSSAVDADKTYLAVAGVIGTMISLGYYLRFALVLYARPSERAVPAHRVPGTLTAGTVGGGGRGGGHLARRRAGADAALGRRGSAIDPAADDVLRTGPVRPVSGFG